MAHKRAHNKRNVLPEDVAIPASVEVNQKLLTDSIASIAGYNTSISNIALEPGLLLFLLSTKEAETSSRIEGTNVTFEDVVLHEDDGTPPKKRSEKREALGVKHAIEEGNKAMEADGLPFSNKVIKFMHEELMRHAASDQGVPGEFRKHKVSVGNRYFPPEPQHVSELMSGLEKYIHSDINVSPVVKIAIVHAQFEIIHPFSDGNGRIGRLLIPFLLKEYGLTDTVSFFISTCFEKQRGEYYTNLENITGKGDWGGWVSFFLHSVAEYGGELKRKVNKLIGLYTDGQFLKLRGVNSQNIKNYIFKHPIFTVPGMIRYFEAKRIKLVNQRGLHKTLTDSPDIEVLTQGRGGRQTKYTCPNIVDVIQSVND